MIFEHTPKPTAMSYPETIKAIVLTGTGDFDVIKKIDVPFPKPAGDELLIKVRALAYNRRVEVGSSFIFDIPDRILWNQLP